MTKRTKKAPKAKRRIEVMTDGPDEWFIQIIFGPNDERRFEAIAPYQTKTKAVRFASELGKLLGWPVEVED